MKKQILTNSLDPEDVVKHMFDKTYTWQQTVSTLAKLERTKDKFIKLIKEHQPAYYNKAFNDIDKFLMIEKINESHGKDKYYHGKD